MLKKALSEDQIIKKLGGFDEVGGACSSQAFSYIANKFGYDVTDFRGEKSRKFFSNNDILDLLTKSGGFKSININGFENVKYLLQYVEKGKEYYFTSGEHSAIIRFKENIVQNKKIYEFLELQASTKKGNGFHELTKEILEERFHAKRRRRKESFDFLIDIKKLKSSHKFRELIGFLNTRI